MAKRTTVNGNIIFPVFMAAWIIATAVAYSPASDAAHASKTNSIIADCIDCHGSDGAKTTKGTPYLAGQNANYLAAAIRAYAKGQRSHKPMQDVARKLEEPQILAIAELYGGLSANWKGAARSEPSKHASLTADELNSVRDSAKPCFSCHGPDGNSVRSGIPSIAGNSPEYFVQAMHAYFQGARADAFMGTFKEALNDTELNQLAAFFAGLQRTKTAAPDKGNVAAGRKNASACAGCHGREGNSAVAEFPSIAGLDATYFAKVMREYRDGTRKNEQMQRVARKLTDTTIDNIAAYYASRDPATIAASTPSKTAAFDPLGDGERAAQPCIGCHGGPAMAPQPGIPRLTGLQSDYLASAINAYRVGERKNDLMKTFTAKLPESDVEKVALYYATQAPSIVNSNESAAAATKEAASACAACHGDGGNSTNSKVPSLAGQDAAYLAQAIADYKSGARANEDMKKAVAELTSESAAGLAHFYNRQTPTAPDVRLPESPIEISARCDRCHGERGYSKEPGKPRLAGQSEAYLLSALREYKHDLRKSTAMHAMSDVLTDIELRAIAAYYARK